MTRRAGPRNARLEETIRSTLAELLLLEINDPRLEGVTISAVSLSGDRSSARVFFSVIGEAERERQAADAFATASSFLRRELGRRMRLRIVPELHFERDTSYEYGDHMERVFERMREEGQLSSSAPASPGSGEGTDDEGEEA